jgi:hypothetical protein
VCSCAVWTCVYMHPSLQSLESVPAFKLRYIDAQLNSSQLVTAGFTCQTDLGHPLFLRWNTATVILQSLPPLFPVFPRLFFWFAPSNVSQHFCFLSPFASKFVPWAKTSMFLIRTNATYDHHVWRRLMYLLMGAIPLYDKIEVYVFIKRLYTTIVHNSK